MESTLAQLTQQVDALGKQVASLQKRLAQLGKFFTVEELDELEGSPSILSIRCSVLTLCDPEQPSRIQGILAGGANGPSLSLWGSDQKARLILSAENDVPR